MILAGLDIGTTGCKVTAYRPDGEYLGRVYRDYPHSRTRTAHEVDPDAIWASVQAVLAEAAAHWPDIAAIGVASFGESFVLLDAQDRPLRPVMLYTDPRGKEECAWLEAALGKEKLAAMTGVNPHPMYSLVKLMWLKAQAPEDWEKTARICLMADYVIYLLTGTAQIDYSLAARTMAFDIRKLDWNDEVLAASGIARALLPLPVPTGTTAGSIKPHLAKTMGLKQDVILVSAGHDQVAAAIGSGVFDEGIAVDGAGTVQCITPVFKGIPDNDGLRRGNYAIVPHAIPNHYVCYAFSYTGGALVDWFIQHFAGHEAADAVRDGQDIHALLEGDIQPDSPTGLLVLPHFAGAATPYMDDGSKGAILGLTLASSRQDIYRAIMEGVCYEARLNMDWLRNAGVNISALRATGGGANSRIWMQMKADILGVPVTSLRTAEAGGAGAAMLAGVALGAYNDLNEAAQALVSERETFYPREDVEILYTKVYEQFERLYSTIRPLV